MSNRRRRRQERHDRIQNWVFGAVGVILLAALGVGLWWVKAREVPVDEATNCPRAGPRAVHALLIDQSDPISPQQAERVRQEMARLRDASNIGERIDIYVMEGDTQNLLTPVLSVCNPGNPRDANQLYENPEQIRRTFEERYAVQVQHTIDALMNATNRPNSPILESIRAIAVGSFGPYDQNTIPLRLTIVSDMVQHSQAVSQFRGETSFTELSRSAAWRGLLANLKGAEVHIFYLLRPSARRGNTPIQNRGHQQFWEQAIAAFNGRLTGLEAL
jgi:hypothetical protein